MEEKRYLRDYGADFFERFCLDFDPDYLTAYLHEDKDEDRLHELRQKTEAITDDMLRSLFFADRYLDGKMFQAGDTVAHYLARYGIIRQSRLMDNDKELLKMTNSLGKPVAYDAAMSLRYEPILFTEEVLSMRFPLLPGGPKTDVPAVFCSKLHLPRDTSELVKHYAGAALFNSDLSRKKAGYIKHALFGLVGNRNSELLFADMDPTEVALERIKKLNDIPVEVSKEVSISGNVPSRDDIYRYFCDLFELPEGEAKEYKQIIWRLSNYVSHVANNGNIQTRRALVRLGDAIGERCGFHIGKMIVRDISQPFPLVDVENKSVTVPPDYLSKNLLLELGCERLSFRREHQKLLEQFGQER